MRKIGIIVIILIVFGIITLLVSSLEVEVSIDENNTNTVNNDVLDDDFDAGDFGTIDEELEGAPFDEFDGDTLIDLTEDRADGEVITHTIFYFDDGFEDGDVTIKQGDTIVFFNNSNRDFWPATDIHPTHRVYPGSDIRKCSTDERSEIFDACEGLSTGFQYGFTFNEVGEWEYHDHLAPRYEGTITVI